MIRGYSDFYRGKGYSYCWNNGFSSTSIQIQTGTDYESKCDSYNIPRDLSLSEIHAFARRKIDKLLDR